MAINLFKSDLSTFKMPTRVALTRVGPVEISTVQLNDMSHGESHYETCIFHDAGWSDVVERYGSKTDALSGHGDWVDLFFNDLREGV